MEKKILIIDDAVFIRTVTSNVLKKAGYTNIFKAGTAKEAKKIFEEQNPDLIILDVTLPDCKDLALCQEFFIRKKDAKVIIYSAVTQQLVIDQALKMGVLAYLNKPMEDKEFIKLVDNTLK